MNTTTKMWQRYTALQRMDLFIPELLAFYNQQINIVEEPLSLSEIINDGNLAVQLSHSQNGIRLLRSEDHYLAKVITANTLNKELENGNSLAHLLALEECGIQLLMSDNYRLAHMITEETLNRKSTAKSPPYKEYYQPMCYRLAQRPSGRLLLCTNDYKLARMITEESLGCANTGKNNRTMPHCLMEDKAGLSILADSNHRLRQLIPPHIVPIDIVIKKPLFDFNYFLSGRPSSPSPIDNWTSCVSNASSTPDYPDDQEPIEVGDFDYSCLYDLLVDEPQDETLHTHSSTNQGVTAYQPSMYISPKYLRQETVTVYSDHSSSTDRSHFSSVDEKKILKQIQLKQLQVDLTSAPAAIVIETSIMTYSLYPATLKSPINQEDQCIFIMAGRQENAWIPTASEKSRILIVLTHEEYQTIAPSTLLQQHYDFLVLEKITSPFITHSLNAITTRRHAAINFAYHHGLASMMMMDDNIDTFLVMNEPYDNGTDYIYSTLLEQQQKTGEPCLSVSTETNLDRIVDPKTLGSKVFMLDMHQIRTKLILETDCLSLFPEQPNTWGEDYLMQLNLHILFGSEKQGYRVIPTDIMQITRSQHHRSACKKTGITANSIPPLSSEFQRALTNSQTANRAIDLFNELTQQQIAFHNVHELKKEHYDFSKAIARKHGYDPERIDDVIAPSFPFTRQLSKNLSAMLTAEMDPPLYSHQKKAIEFLISQLDASRDFRSQYTFNMATGTGKTLVQAIIAFQSFLANPNKNVIIISPSIALVNQSQDALINHAKSIFPLAIQNIIIPRLLPICTGKISWLSFKANQELSNRKHIFIMCIDSATELLTHSPMHIINSSTILYDESHLVAKESFFQTMDRYRTKYYAESGLNKDILSLLFSATPTVFSADKAQFNYTREQAITEGILPPVVVDNSLDDALTASEIIHALNHHTHPNGGVLRSHKGIIYVRSRAEATQLAAELKEKSPELNLMEIHSGVTHYAEAIMCFKAELNCLAISVQMLVEGFDDIKLDWTLINKHITIPASRSQIMGRLTRKDSENPDKIGLVLMLRKTSLVTPTEKSCFPLTAIIPDYQPISHTLELLRTATPCITEDSPWNSRFFTSFSCSTTMQTRRDGLWSCKKSDRKPISSRLLISPFISELNKRSLNIELDSLESETTDQSNSIAMKKARRL